MNLIYGGRVPRPRMIMMSAFALTCAAIFIAIRFFGDQPGTISVFFAVMGILPTVDVLIQSNKMKTRDIDLLEDRGKFKADTQLAGALLILFLGVMLAYGASALVVPVERIITLFAPQVGPFVEATGPSYRLEHVWGLMAHNLGVAAGVLALSILYRTSGALLVLVWNASVWGVVFAYFARVQEQAGLQAFISFGKTMICILPHSLAEAMAYIMSALAGIVVVRLLARAPDDEGGQRRLALNAGGLIFGSMIVLAGAAALEVTLAPYLLRVVTPS